jgi:DNA-binding TFAR19-related protein (PDSD5 family)
LIYVEELMVIMSDSDLEAIRRNKLRELQRRLTTKQNKTEEIDTNDVLKQVFKGRAWEVFNSAYQQFPGIMAKVKDALVRLALSGRLKEVTGEQLYSFLRNVGLRVRLKTKIRFAEHGKLKSLTEKMKEDL